MKNPNTLIERERQLSMPLYYPIPIDLQKNVIIILKY